MLSKERHQTATGPELLPSIFGYILSPVAKVIIPIGIVLGVYYRSRPVVVLFILLTIIFFGLTHHKSVLAAPVVVLAFYLALERFSVQKCLAFLFLAVATICLLELIWRHYLGLDGSGLFSTFIIRRVFFIPALLDNFYVQYFAENTMYFWANSRVSLGFVDTSYEVTSAFLIGEELFGRHNVSANTGFVGSGYSNAGTVGVVAYGLAIGLIIALLSAHGRAIGHSLAICSSLIVVISAITSSDLLTVMITHGLILLLLWLSIIPKQESTKGFS